MAAKAASSSLAAGSAAEASRLCQQVGLPVATPRRAGLDPAPFEALRAETRREVEEDHQSPGVAHVVLKRGRCVFAEACGWADKEQRTPFTLRTMCRLHGATRPLVAAAFLTLVDDGSVGLDDEVQAYISFPCKVRGGSGTTSKTQRPATLRDLVCHTAGIGYEDSGDYGAAMAAVRAKRVRSLEGLCNALTKKPLLFQPGTRYEYSFCTDFLGRVCEVVSGLDLQEFLRRRILAPLGMNDTYFLVPAAKRKQYATLYERIEGGTAKRQRTSSGEAAKPRPALAPLEAPFSAKVEGHLVAGAWVRLLSVAAGQCLQVTDADGIACGPKQRPGRSQLFSVQRADGRSGAIVQATPVVFFSAAKGKFLEVAPQRSSGKAVFRFSDVGTRFTLCPAHRGAGANRVPMKTALCVRGVTEEGSLGVAPASHARVVTMLPDGHTRACRFELLPADPPCDPEAAPEIASGGGGVLSYTDAGIASCARDYARFLAMLMNGGSLGGRRVLKKETVESLMCDQMERFGTARGARVKGWHDGSHFWDHTGWSLLSAHVDMDRPIGSKKPRVAKRMWMAGSGGPGWAIDTKRDLACVTFASVLGGCWADAEAAAVVAADRALRQQRRRAAAKAGGGPKARRRAARAATARSSK